MKNKNHLVICHCPSTAKILRIAAEFRASISDDMPVVVVTDQLDECPDEWEKNGVALIRGVPSMESTLLRATAPEAAGVIVLSRDPTEPASDALSYAVASMASHIAKNPDQRLIVEVVRRENMPMMERLAADGLVPLEGFSENLLVQELMNPGLRQVFDELVSYHKGAEFYITPHELPDRPFIDFQIAALKSKGNLQIVGRIRQGLAELPPPTGASLGPHDQLVIIAGERGDFLSFQNQFLTQE